VIAVGASPAAAADVTNCSAFDVEYVIVARMVLRDTAFGAANGVYPLGTGTVRLRFETRPAGAARQAKLVSYELDNHFTVKAVFALWATNVVTDARTTVASTCDGAAQGTLDGSDLTWRTKVEG
jgi:hypothetical protein